MNKQPHILAKKNDIAPNVLLPGDPARSTYIATNYLTNARLIGQYREFITYTGSYKSVPITVTSTGIGCPSTAIAVEEIINCGAKNLIRVGTCCGALKREIKPGSIIIPIACIREEGTTKEYIPTEFPAVADYRIVSTLINAARKNTYQYFAGINRTHDAFYGATSNIKRWGSPYLEDRMKDWSYPLISSEMESSVLFIIALMRGVRAGAVLAVNANPEPLEDIVKGTMKFDAPDTHITTSEAKKSVDRAIITALESLIDMDTKGENYGLT